MMMMMRGIDFSVEGRMLLLPFRPARLPAYEIV
jgi:hypothetical protein